MKFYKKLNLCSSPIKEGVIRELMNKKEEFRKEVDRSKVGVYKHLYANDEIEKFVNPILLEKLSAINLKPAILINFSEGGSTYETWLHRDLACVNNEWVPMEVGLNWELTEGTTTFKWYTENGNNCKKSALPQLEGMVTQWPRSFINGIRYYDENELSQIASLTYDINTAYLVRTDLPHKVISHSPGGRRHCISIRFFVKDVPTFDRALELFEPYYA